MSPEDFSPQAPPAPETDTETFFACDVRAGTIVAAEIFAEARKPAYKLWLDFGPVVGQKQSSAQITVHYRPDDLVGRKVAAVINFPTRKIAGFKSEVLVLGFADENGNILLVSPAPETPDGARLH